MGSAYSQTLGPYSVSGNASPCTSIDYVLTSTSSASVDSIFTFTASPPSISVVTSDPLKVGTYSFRLTGTLSGDAQTDYEDFSIVVHTKCYDQSMTHGSISDMTTYQVDGSAVTQTFAASTLSPTSPCSAITYSLLTDTGATINTAIFSFSASTRVFSYSTSLASDIGTYNFILHSSLDGDAQTTATSFLV
jgi:hypothetical protein